MMPRGRIEQICGELIHTLGLEPLRQMDKVDLESCTREISRKLRLVSRDNRFSGSGFQMLVARTFLTTLYRSTQPFVHDRLHTIGPRDQEDIESQVREIASPPPDRFTNLRWLDPSRWTEFRGDELTDAIALARLRTIAVYVAAQNNHLLSLGFDDIDEPGYSEDFRQLVLWLLQPENARAQTIVLPPETSSDDLGNEEQQPRAAEA